MLYAVLRKIFLCSATSRKPQRLGQQLDCGLFELYIRWQLLRRTDDVVHRPCSDGQHVRSSRDTRLLAGLDCNQCGQWLLEVIVGSEREHGVDRGIARTERLHRVDPEAV